MFSFEVTSRNLGQMTKKKGETAQSPGYTVYCQTKKRNIHIASKNLRSQVRNHNKVIKSNTYITS